MVFENPRFRPSIRKQKAGVQSVFEKDAFSVTVFTGYMWTVDQTGGKKYPFSKTKKDTWGRGFN